MDIFMIQQTLRELFRYNTKMVTLFKENANIDVSHICIIMPNVIFQTDTPQNFKTTNNYIKYSDIKYKQRSNNLKFQTQNKKSLKFNKHKF